MTTEQQRNMLECAAKACGYTVQYRDYGHSIEFLRRVQPNVLTSWNPLTNPADTAEMCAKLWIDWINSVYSVISVSAEYDCEAFLKDHDNSRLKAWMHAATMVAARIGGYKE